MIYLRRILKYFYPKPRKKTVCVLIFAFLCFNIFFMLRTSHRKEKHSLLPGNTILSHIGIGYFHKKEAVLKKEKITGDGEAVDSAAAPGDRVESVLNVYNLTVKSVLVLTDSETSKTNDQLKFVFKSMKVNFDFVTWNRFDDNFQTLPRLVDKYNIARYQAIVFTHENIFDSLDSYNWDLIKRLCQQYNTGIIILCNPTQSDTVQSKRLKFLPLSLLHGVKHLEDVEIPTNDVLEIVKSPNILPGKPAGKDHVLFYTKHSTFTEIMLTNIADSGVRTRRDTRESLEVRMTENKVVYSIEKSPVILYDKGEFDGVRKFIFGVSFWESWLYQLVLVDALNVISDGQLGFGLKRHVQIDIDDIFVGKTGRRIIKEDVDVSDLMA